MIASVVLSVLTMTALFFGLNTVDILMMTNLLLLSLGLAIVIILDRNIPLSVHITTVYFFLLATLSLVAGTVAFFDPDVSVSIFFVLTALGLLYIFFPNLLERIYVVKNIPLVKWHFSNCILACSWAIFGYIFWGLFW